MRTATIAITLVLLTGLAIAPTATADPGPGPCMDVYREYNVGPVQVVSPNSCTYHVYVFGEPLIG